MKKMLNTSQDNNFIGNYYASVAKLANALALGASGATLLGSSPSRRTNKIGMVSSVVSEMLKTNENTSESNSTRKQNCCTRRCIEEEMLQFRNGKLIVGSIIEVVISSKTCKKFVSLRN